MLAEINWGNFAAKFSANKQVAFERLCYLLFCREFNKSTGIFRFRNHAGIETNPVEQNGIVVGWQAKFYETSLAGHKVDFIDSIDTTSTRHPTLNKIVFYTNKEFGQDPKGKDPSYKVEIETHAKSKGIDIEWRTESYFESPFVCEQNFSIAQHFFSLNKGILDSIAELSIYAESVLKPIRSEILFGDRKIKIDRSNVVASLRDLASSTPLVILSGGVGVGKTAIIKDFHETAKTSIPLFVFKATQFKNISHINELFKNYGQITSTDFINEHKDIGQKYVIVDSAEKLSEIENQDIFRMFLSNLLESGWNVIFTVRYSYLDDLKFQLKEFYGANFSSLNIPNLSSDEAEKISRDHNFTLPKSERLRDLLMTPLYLSEYLQNYADITERISYADFRDIIWRKQIQNSGHQLNNLHRRREECFLKIAQQRANEGGFFVKTNGYDQEALQKLEADEIIKYDSNAGGYFITHDVYEEWALDKIIEISFLGARDYQNFYQEIGSSLPTRRAFRSWLSDKLFANDEYAKRLIDFTVKNDQVDNHWKDEVLVFEEELLKEPEKSVSHDGSSSTVRTLTINYKYEDRLLHKVVFLLRVACKTIDEDFLHRLGLTKTSAISLKNIFTTPKGSGWNSTISFINKHKEKLKFRYMNVILPMLDDWNRSPKQGEATKDASQIALFYYNELTKEDGFYFSSHDDTKDKLIRTILNGSSEIKTELTQIVDGVIANKDTSHRGRYYELVKVILSSIIDSSEISKHLPKEVMKLANLFWFYTPNKTRSYSDHRNDIEQYFDLAEGHLEYYPASALQTPIFQLLQTEPKETADFILSFTNRSISYFAKTEFAQYEAKEIDILCDDSDTPIKQYICHRIWNIYRGTQVAPPLLESIHMALERWLLMIAKTTTPEILEKWCLYLVKNSNSASITAIVASVVLAEPSQLFNVAKILFRTKDLFFFDIARVQLDMSAKSGYSMSHDPGGVFKNERLQTCEDKHRSHSLETLALNYQLFIAEGEEEEVAKKRQEVLWRIFDEYYKQLPDKSKETEEDKTWRLCLARMDRRKINITTEEKDDQILITFNPEIDPELKKYSEDSLAKNTEAMKFLPLQLWSRNKFEGNENYKKYIQYDNDHSLVISETKEIVQNLKNDKSEDGSFTLFYRSVPSYTCAVLIRDYLDKLKPLQKKFCKNTILDYSSLPLRVGYQYQVGDGLGVAINVLPLLLKVVPADSKKIKETLLLILFDSYPIGMDQRVSDYAVSAVLQHLWKESPEDANAIFLGYLLLKPKFDHISDSIRKANRKKNIYNFSTASVLKRFKRQCKSEISKAVSNQLVYSDVSNVADVDPGTLVTALLLLPLRTIDESHKKFLRDISSVLIESLRNNDREERLDYELEQGFFQKFAHFVLTSKKEDIESYLRPFIELIGAFGTTRDVDRMLSEFINAEDALNQYEEFWTVWKIFYPKMVELCGNENLLRYSTSTVHNYLLALEWKPGVREWHSLKEREKTFFRKVAEDIGHNPAVLYSLSKLLNDIGSGFATDGIFWISDILKKNPELSRKGLEVDTVYYLENLVRSYILKNRHKIKTTLQLKTQILVILDFLLEKASVTAYLLREDIL